jgi:hypothetical protein
MRLGRIIFAVLLMLSTTWSLAEAYPAGQMPGADQLAATSSSDAHSCCEKSKPAKSDAPHKRGANCPGKCTMQCCRMLPTQAQPAPTLHLAADAALPADPLAPPALHALTEAEAIFHPPRV